MTLTPESQKLYDKIRRQWRIAEEPGRTVLMTAMQARDRLVQAQGIIEAEGLMITDRFGQKKAHPATVIEREARAGLLMALKALDLDLETLDDAEEA